MIWQSLYTNEFYWLIDIKIFFIIFIKMHCNNLAKVLERLDTFSNGTNTNCKVFDWDFVW